MPESRDTDFRVSRHNERLNTNHISREFSISRAFFSLGNWNVMCNLLGHHSLPQTGNGDWMEWSVALGKMPLHIAIIALVEQSTPHYSWEMCSRMLILCRCVWPCFWSDLNQKINDLSQKVKSKNRDFVIHVIGTLKKVQNPNQERTPLPGKLILWVEIMNLPDLQKKWKKIWEEVLWLYQKKKQLSNLEIEEPIPEAPWLSKYILGTTLLHCIKPLWENLKIWKLTVLEFIIISKLHQLHEYRKERRFLNSLKILLFEDNFIIMAK